jgi:phosphoglycerol transferase MdoB-like AlkP superfamily enzyme
MEMRQNLEYLKLLIDSKFAIGVFVISSGILLTSLLAGYLPGSDLVIGQSVLLVLPIVLLEWLILHIIATAAIIGIQNETFSRNLLTRVSLSLAVAVSICILPNLFEQHSSFMIRHGIKLYLIVATLCCLFLLLPKRNKLKNHRLPSFANCFFLFIIFLIFISKIYLFYSCSLLIASLSPAYIMCSFVLEVIPLLIVIHCKPIQKKILMALKFAIFIYIVNLFINLIYFVETREFISTELLRNINMYSIAGFATAKYLLFFSVLLVLVILTSITTYSAIIKMNVTLNASIAIVIVFAGILLDFSIKKTWYEMSKMDPMQVMLRMGKQKALNRLVVPSYYSTFTSVYTYFSISYQARIPDSRDLLSESEIKWLNDNSISQLLSNKVDNVAPPKKIILITAESVPLSYFPFNNEKIPHDVTPFLNSIANEQGYFKHFYTAGMPTDHGLTALLCSYPYFSPQLGDNMKCLPEFFKSLGYETFLFSGSSLYYGGHNITYKQQFKFDHMFGEDEYAQKADWGWGVADKVVLNKVINETITSREKKQFIVVNLMDTHPPYYARESNLKYDDKLFRSLNTLDSNLDKFVRGIKSNNLWKDSLIILTSDHSPNHGDYLKWSGAKDYSPARLPLFFLGDSTITKKLNNIDREQIYSQLDIAPTLNSIIYNHNSFNYLGSSMFDVMDKNSRHYVPSIYSRKICFSSKTNFYPTDSSLDTIETASETVQSNAIRKTIYNNFYIKNAR